MIVSLSWPQDHILELCLIHAVGECLRMQWAYNIRGAGAIPVTKRSGIVEDIGRQPAALHSLQYVAVLYP